MKRAVLVLLFLSVFIITKAQTTGVNTITGTVMDSVSKQALDYATITLSVAGNAKLVTGTITDRNGSFKLQDIPDGIYIITIEFIGYDPLHIAGLHLNKSNKLINLKRLALSQQKGSLQAVTVVAQAKVVENKIDKMVYNAEKDISSQTGVAADVLKKVPLVSIDVDGKVELAGSSGVRFLINGKPSAAFGSTITDVLQSIPASQIKSIEVITNPGAKYDAQGIGGIINIILKTNKTKGYNGSLSLSAGTRIENGSFNFNVRNNNFGFNAFVSGNTKLAAKTTSVSDRTTGDSGKFTSLHQQSTSTFERHNYDAGMGFDWTYKKHNSFTGAISYNNFGSSNDGNTNQNIYDVSTGSDPVSSYMNINKDFSFGNIDANLNYKRTFAKEDQELEIAINSSALEDHNLLANNQFLLPQDSLFYGTDNKNPIRNNQTDISIDYTQPIKKNIVLGIGTKASFNTIKSNSDVWQYDPESQNFLYNPSLSNNLTYRQKVYAAYSEIGFPVSTWFQAKIGVRYERTDIDASYSNAQQQVNIPGYNTLAPSIFFSKKMGNTQTIKLSYSKRINRPEHDDLNPFVNTSDPKNLVTGNPLLKPEITHRFELNYIKDIGKKGTLMIGLFYRVNDDDIQPYIVYYSSYKAGDSVYTNVALSRSENIGMERNLGISLFANINLTDKLSLRGNGLVFERHTVNTLDKGYNYNSFNYRFNLNATYLFTKTLAAEFFGNFRSARNEAQGKYPSFTTYSIAARKQFWKQKGSIALTADNFLHENITQKTILSGPGFSTNAVREVPSRSMGLNFTWKFGKLEFKKNKPAIDANNNSSGD